MTRFLKKPEDPGGVCLRGLFHALKRRNRQMPPWARCRFLLVVILRFPQMIIRPETAFDMNKEGVVFLYGPSRIAKRALGAGAALALAVLLCAGGRVKAMEPRMLVPVGHTVGIKLFSRGVVVVKLTDGGTPARECGLRTGDVIVKCGGNASNLQIDQAGDRMTLSVEPSQNDQGVYCIGAWVRDSMAGIGTMTWYD